MGMSQAKPHRENLWLNLIFNVAVPFLILSKLSGEKAWEPAGGIVSIPGFGPLGGLLVALSFPLIYGLYDLLRRRKWNVLSIIGLSSVLLSGGLGLLELDPFWFAVKEAAIPLAIGAVVVGSLLTPKPLVRAFLLNPDLVDTERLEGAIRERGAEVPFKRLLVVSTLRLGLLFVFSAILNFVVARALITSPPQTEAFNEELARMNVWSLVIITLPMMLGLFWALIALFKGIQSLTGLALEELLTSQK